MKRARREHPERFIGGRHVATISTDELWYLYRQGRAVEEGVNSELAFRMPAKTRTVAKGYVPFSRGLVGAIPKGSAEQGQKRDHPNRPSNVKDAKKDRKKNEEK